MLSLAYAHSVYLAKYMALMLNSILNKINRCNVIDLHMGERKMDAELTWIAAGESKVRTLFISLPSGQLAFQSYKLSNDELVGRLHRQVGK